MNDIDPQKVLVIPRRRLMFVQLKTGHDIDRGPAWIAWLDSTKTSGASTVDDDARAAYDAFLAGAPLPGREHG